jgi:hypothetical protein
VFDHCATEIRWPKSAFQPIFLTVKIQEKIWTSRNIWMLSSTVLSLTENMPEKLSLLNNVTVTLKISSVALVPSDLHL